MNFVSVWVDSAPIKPALADNSMSRTRMTIDTLAVVVYAKLKLYASSI